MRQMKPEGGDLAWLCPQLSRAEVRHGIVNIFTRHDEGMACRLQEGWHCCEWTAEPRLGSVRFGHWLQNGQRHAGLGSRSHYSLAGLELVFAPFS
jgi:hypothetical protein